VKEIKTIYKFKPNGHWNYITKEVYEVLRKFYSDEMLKIEEEDE
jgi:hypothetical protein